MRIRVCINNQPIKLFESLKNALDFVGKEFYVSPEGRALALQRLGSLKTATLTYGVNAATITFIDEGEPALGGTQ